MGGFKMKRMDEIFKFPLDVDENNNKAYLSDGEVYIATFDGAKLFDDPIALHQARHAAHAISHVDALADALDALLKELELTYIHNSNLVNRECEAKEVLDAYRGES